MIKLMLLFCSLFCCLSVSGLKLTVEGQEQPLTIKKGKYLGGGGSKDAYAVEDGYALLLPNYEVKDWPVMWERMVNEEVAFDEFYSKFIKTSGVKKATYIEKNETKYALYSKNFEAYQNEGAFILDGKNTEYPMNFSDRIPEKNESAWVEMLMPVVNQHSQMIRTGVHPPGGDMLSFLYAAQGSTHSLHLNKGPSVSMFGFDFTSKCHERTPEDYFGPPRPFTERAQEYLENDLYYLMRDLLRVKHKDERFRPTEEDKTFIKNISEKCVSAITNALLSDDEYIERLAQSQLEKIEKEKKEMREFEIETDKRILERIEIENRLLESLNMLKN